MARVAQYTEQVSSLVTEPMKVEIERLADQYQVSQGVVVRLAMEGDGLKSVENSLRGTKGLQPIGILSTSEGLTSPFSG